ncbi:MAG: Gfo/Idh/MocA family oxidoreductase [Methylibium sp.]|nr:Gfo/Idh/MocA family oxidoreductase [Methylibium sp.]
MNIGIVGCGFVADYYLATLELHPELRVKAVTDRRPERAEHLSQRYAVPCVSHLDAMLAMPEIELVLNLTNPRDHYAVSKAALRAGKHVYSEKPLAMAMDEARDLVREAHARRLLIASAPCSVLGETAQTLWKALREEVVGPVRLVYAEMDDGLVHLMPYRKWTSVSGVPWPYKDEFEVGCTVEHAGYCLTWLLAWFGPAQRVTSYASIRIPDKVPGETLDTRSPDFSVACIEFASGVVARLTCSIVAPHNHEIRIIGDRGMLETSDCWNYRSAVYSRRLLTIRRRTLYHPIRRRHGLPASPYGRPRTKGAQSMDFARGPAEMAAALREGRACRLSADFALHVNELTLAIHHAGTAGAAHRMTTRFDPMEPMPWAR